MAQQPPTAQKKAEDEGVMSGSYLKLFWRVRRSWRIGRCFPRSIPSLRGVCRPTFLCGLRWGRIGHCRRCLVARRRIEALGLSVELLLVLREDTARA